MIKNKFTIPLSKICGFKKAKKKKRDKNKYRDNRKE